MSPKARPTRPTRVSGRRPAPRDPRRAVAPRSGRGASAVAPPERRRPGVMAVAITAALTLSLAGTAVVHRAADGAGHTSTDNVVSTSAGPARLACAPGPRLQATSGDKQFSAGRGVAWSQTHAAAVADSTGGLQAGQLARTDAPVVSTPSSTSDASSSTAPGDDATEVPRPAPRATTSGAASASPLVDVRRNGKLFSSHATGLVAQMFAAQPSPTGQPLVGGLSASTTGSGDLRGLATAACAAPSENVWLVGGRAGTGSGGRVVVSNPSEVSATVDLRLLTPGGVLTPPVGTGLVIGPHGTREVLLRSLTQQQSVLAVGVFATGAPVAAFLVDQRVSGTRPAGVDIVGDTAPGRRQVLMGAGAAGESAVLRLAVPGTRESTVTYRTEAADGSFSKPRAVTIAAGSVQDVELPDPPQRTSRIVVEADQPIVAGLELTHTAGGVSDLAWASGSAQLADPVVVPLPAVPGASGSLLVSAGAAPGADGAHVVLERYDASGRKLADVSLTVPPTGVLTAPAAALFGVRNLVIRPQEPVHVALNLTGSGRDKKPTMISSVAIPPAPGTQVKAVIQHAGPGDWP